MTKLSQHSYSTVTDASLSLVSVIKRPFKRASVTIKKMGSDETLFVCSKQHSGKRVIKIHAIKHYFSSDFVCHKHKCKWHARLVKEGHCYYFEEISPLRDHCAKCFTGKYYRPVALNKLGIEKMVEGKLSEFNEKLFTKTGLRVPLKAINKHLAYRKKIAQADDIDYLKIYNDEPNKLYNLSEEGDKKIVGMFLHNNKKDKDFKYHCSVDEANKLKFIVSLQPSQLEAISNFGDLLFIDSTFNLNVQKFNAINFVVINNEYRSVIGACAFVKNETTDAHLELLKFIKKNVCFKRLPLCVISDGALQIHSAVAEVFPYAKHVYCAFHSLRSGKMWPKDKSVSELTKATTKMLVHTMLVSTSITEVMDSASKLLVLAESQTDKGVKKRLLELCGHAFNASRPYQKVFSADTISSSRVESMNSFVKRKRLNKLTPVFRSVKELLNAFNDQAGACQDVDNTVWEYFSDSAFHKCLGDKAEEIFKNVTNQLLENMHFEYKCAANDAYNVKHIEGTMEYDVQFKGDLSKIPRQKRRRFKKSRLMEQLAKLGVPKKVPVYDVHRVVHKGDGLFHCDCCARMGYPCRHIFSVLDKTNVPLSINNINTRFWIKVKNSMLEKINKDAFNYMLEYVKETQKDYGKLISMNKYANILDNVGGDPDELLRIFEQDLEYYMSMINNNNNTNGKEPYLGKIGSKPKKANVVPPKASKTTNESEDPMPEDNNINGNVGDSHADNNETSTNPLGVGMSSSQPSAAPTKPNSESNDESSSSAITNELDLASFFDNSIDSLCNSFKKLNRFAQIEMYTKCAQQAAESLAEDQMASQIKDFLSILPSDKISTLFRGVLFNKT